MPGRQATWYSSVFFDKLLARLNHYYGLLRRKSAKKKSVGRPRIQAAAIRYGVSLLAQRRASHTGPVLQEVLVDSGITDALASECVAHLVTTGILTDDPEIEDPANDPGIPDVPPLARAIFNFLGSSPVDDEQLSRTMTDLTGLDQYWPRPRNQRPSSQQAVDDDTLRAVLQEAEVEPDKIGRALDLLREKTASNR